MKLSNSSSAVAAILGLSFQLAACGSGGDPATSNPGAAGNSNTTTAQGGTGSVPATSAGSGAGASAVDQCMRDVGAVTMHSLVALGVPPSSEPHVSDSAFQAALAATQARTRALYGKPAPPSQARPGIAR